MSSGANGAGTDRDMEMLFRAVCGSISLSMNGSAARFDEAAHMAGRLAGKLDPKAARRMLRRAAQEIGYETDLIESAIDREYARGEKEAIERGVVADITPVPLPAPVSAATFARVEPPPRQFIDGHDLFLAKRLNVLTGAGQVGKSLVIMQLCCAYALKEDRYPEASWLGQPLRRRGRVLYLTTEDDLEECSRRIRAIAALEGIEISDLRQLDVIDLTDKEARALFQASRNSAVQRTKLLEELEHRIALDQYDLVIIDNRAQAVDANEIDRSVATKVAGVLDVIARKMSVTIILLAHPSLSGIANGSGASGSTAWFNAVRNQVNMRRPDVDQSEAKDAPDDGRRELVAGKTNYSQSGRKLNLQWTAGAYVCTDKPERAGSDIGRADRAERVFLALLKLFAERGVAVSANPKANNYAPKVFMTNDNKREGIPLKTLKVALDSLWERGAIRAVRYGSPSDNTYRLEVV